RRTSDAWWSLLHSGDLRGRTTLHKTPDPGIWFSGLHPHVATGETAYSQRKTRAASAVNPTPNSAMTPTSHRWDDSGSPRQTPCSSDTAYDIGMTRAAARSHGGNDAIG